MPPAAVCLREAWNEAGSIRHMFTISCNRYASYDKKGCTYKPGSDQHQFSYC